VGEGEGQFQPEGVTHRIGGLSLIPRGLGHGLDPVSTRGIASRPRWAATAPAISSTFH
jgi:hypothetical protein